MNADPITESEIRNSGTRGTFLKKGIDRTAAPRFLRAHSAMDSRRCGRKVCRTAQGFTAGLMIPTDSSRIMPPSNFKSPRNRAAPRKAEATRAHHAERRRRDASRRDDGMNPPSSRIRALLSHDRGPCESILTYRHSFVCSPLSVPRDDDGGIRTKEFLIRALLPTNEELNEIPNQL